MSGYTRQLSARQGAVQDITLGASAVNSNAFGAQTYQVRLSATSACYYLITEGSEGTTVNVTTSNGSYLPANVIEYVTVTPGQKLSAIEASAAGTLNITELT